MLFGPIRDDPPPSPSSRSRRGSGWLRISDASVEEVGIDTVLAEQSGTFMLYYERVLPPPSPFPVPYAESVRTQSSEETVMATPTTPPAVPHATTPTHAPERRKRTHSVANNEAEEEGQVGAEQLTDPNSNPQPDLRLPRVNGGHVPVVARTFRSTSVGMKSGSQGNSSRSSSIAPPPPPVANGINIVNGHADAAIAQGPTYTHKVNGTIPHGPPPRQAHSPTRKKKKKNSSSISTGNGNINGAPARTLDL